MITRDEDAQALTDQIIQESFPDLWNEKIVVAFEDTPDCFLLYGTLKEGRFKTYYIDIDPLMQTAPIDAFRGGLIHEVSHISRDKSMTFIDHMLYKFFQSYRIMDERNTDLTALIRGYGREMLAFETFAQKHRHANGEGITLTEYQKLVSPIPDLAHRNS